jgi:putative Holliday junction resolvase
LSELNQETPSAELPPYGRLAGIDFGTVRIGVAICDPSQTIASPLETYNRRTIALDAKYFVDLATREQIVGFVVGLPVHMSGDASQKSKQAEEFGSWLLEQTGIPVAWIDERYTTAMAREVLSQSNLSGKKRKAQLDKLAAQIILAAYLESGPTKNAPPIDGDGSETTR